jgi:hypothetical protein
VSRVLVTGQTNISRSFGSAKSLSGITASS